MKTPIAFVLLVILLVNISCNNQKTKKTTSYTKQQDTSLLVLDSIQIAKFCSQYPGSTPFQKNIESFYLDRDFVFAWFDKNGLNEYALNFMNLLKQEKLTSDIIPEHEELDLLSDMYANEISKFNRKDTIHTYVELLFTTAFFEYAQRNWSGINSSQEKAMSWFIHNRNVKYEDLLDSVLTQKPLEIHSFEPYYRQYALLKNFFKKYRAIEKNNQCKPLPDSIPEMKVGASSAFIPLIKNNLFLLDDLSFKDTSSIFNNNLIKALKHFQNRNGLIENGELTFKTIQLLKKPISDLIQQILINMERSKWVPESQAGDYLVVNIPAYKLYVYQNQSLQWSCNVVVGKSKVTNNTVIFNDNLEYIVFSPFWNVTSNILIKELLPALKRNRRYLSRLNMEVVDNKGKLIPTSSIRWKTYHTSFPYIVRQKPGVNNSLGLVKFIFPNSFDIYMHDSPQKSLFNEQERDFSHGCIRIEKPLELSKFLLRNDTSYTEDKILKLMHGGKQTYVKLKSKVYLLCISLLG
jgi:murein L,D-transpeptidase YcbB/YkuD